MLSTERLVLVSALVGGMFCPTLSSLSSGVFHSSAYRRKPKLANPHSTKFQYKGKKSEESHEHPVVTQLDDVTEEESLPLTPAEQTSKDLKNAAKGAAVGGAMGGAGCAGINAIVLIHNSLANTATAAIAFPGLTPLVPFIASGLLVGGLWGYGTSK